MNQKDLRNLDASFMKFAPHLQGRFRSHDLHASGTGNPEFARLTLLTNPQLFQKSQRV